MIYRCAVLLCSIVLLAMDVSAQRHTFYCNDDEYCDTLDNMGLVLQKANDSLYRINGITGGPYYVVRDSFEKLFFKSAKCQYCIGSTHWVLKNGDGEVLMRHPVELRHHWQVTEIPDFKNMPGGMYTVEMEIPDHKNWLWRIHLSDPYPCDAQIIAALPEGWKFRYTYWQPGFMLLGGEAYRYENQLPKFYSTTADDEVREELGWFKMYSSPIMADSHSYLPELRYSWSHTVSADTLNTRSQMQDSIWQARKAVFEARPTYENYKEMNEASYRIHMEGTLLITNDRGKSFLAHPLHPYALKEEDQRELEALNDLVESIVEECIKE